MLLVFVFSVFALRDCGACVSRTRDLGECLEGLTL